MFRHGLPRHLMVRCCSRRPSSSARTMTNGWGSRTKAKETPT